MKVYHVHWLKAKSRRDCWREERTLLESEMKWTELFFQHQASCWNSLATASSVVVFPDSSIAGEPEPHTRHSKGHTCYALKLESMWNRLAQQAASQFSTAKAKIQPQQDFARSGSATDLSS
jgi:hypothetical protein